MRRHVPGYAKPSQIVLVDEIQRGKRGLLDEGFMTASRPKQSDEAKCQGETEEQLQSMWVDVLGLEAGDAS